MNKKRIDFFFRILYIAAHCLIEVYDDRLGISYQVDVCLPWRSEVS